MPASKNVAPEVRLVPLPYHTLRTVTSPEDHAAKRRRYCGVASADSFFSFDTKENVRTYLSEEIDGKAKKATKVNRAIKDTLENQRDDFSLLNAGIVLIARDAQVDDNSKRVTLLQPSIINGAQTQGVLKDYFEEHPED